MRASPIRRHGTARRECGKAVRTHCSGEIRSAKPAIRRRPLRRREGRASYSHKPPTRGPAMRAPVSSAAALLLTLAAGAAQAAGVETREPISPYKPAFEGQTRAPEQKLGVAFQATDVAQGLKFPWAIALLPDGRLLVTERPGALRIVGKDGTVSEPLAGVPQVMNR